MKKNRRISSCIVLKRGGTTNGHSSVGVGFASASLLAGSGCRTFGASQEPAKVPEGT
jgi:hypothetical protein